LLSSRRINRTSIATPSLLWSACQHPPFAALGHVSSGQIGIATERIEPTTATTEAAGTSRAATTATAGTSTWTTAATAARTAGPATSTTTAIPIAAMPIVIARVSIAPTFGSRHHVHHVVKFTLLLGVGRRLVTRKDAHQAHPSRAFAHHRERLHQA
jgi:hypothetical protein